MDTESYNAYIGSIRHTHTQSWTNVHLICDNDNDNDNSAAAEDDDDDYDNQKPSMLLTVHSKTRNQSKQDPKTFPPI